MGNIVLSSAIRVLGTSQIAGTYLAMQSADVAAAYDPTAAQMTKSTDPDFILRNFQRIQPVGAFNNVLTPDLFRFDNPRAQRPVPATGLYGADPLNSPADGYPLASSMRGTPTAPGAFGRRINLYNPVDYATAGAFYSNAYTRINGDTGYRYQRVEIPGIQFFSDGWEADVSDSNVPSWIRRPSFFYMPLSWVPEDPFDIARATHRAVILSMLTAPRSRTVGADLSGLPAVFTRQRGEQFGMGSDSAHHSFQYNLTIHETRQVWEYIRSLLN